MKQIVVLSGKGGTGKTTVTAAFAHLASQTPATRAILVDADVDAANLELVLSPQLIKVHDFIGGKVAVIDSLLCGSCGTCADACRFDAITAENGTYAIDTIDCEGCAACKTQCPNEAISMEPQLDGNWFYSHSRYGPLLHARLKPARENSGKLVALLKQQACTLAENAGSSLVIVDGPPGIGCAVIAAISGADMLVIVTEPTVAGIHDLKRTLELVQHFRIPALICINKADLYREGTEAIADYCQEKKLPLLGHLPYTTTVVEAMIQCQPITAYAPDAPISEAVGLAWEQTLSCLTEGINCT